MAYLDPFLARGIDIPPEDQEILNRWHDTVPVSDGCTVPRLLSFEEAMEYYRIQGSMDSRRMEIAERIWRERIKSREGETAVTKEEAEILASTGPYNMGVCEELFGRFGVVFE